jgi:hypothetical protein
MARSHFFADDRRDFFVNRRTGGTGGIGGGIGGIGGTGGGIGGGNGAWG